MPRAKKNKSDDVGAIFNDAMKQQDTNSEHEHGITISVKDLPACEHKSALLSVISSESVKICIIAVKHKKYWQAYAGYPDIRDLRPITNDELKSIWEWDCEHIHDAAQVAMLGYVLPKSIAEQLFPDWKKRKYKQ